MKKTLARLADGREIIYFDESDDADRELWDERALTPFSPTSEVRFDPLRREWVVMASHRQGRTHLPTTDDCPLCPSMGDRRTEIPSRSYDVVAFENRFPSLSSMDSVVGGPVDPLSSRHHGAGRCEVLCFSSDHNTSFADLSPQRVRTVVEAWSDRALALSTMRHVQQVFCFENRGQEIGVTLHHPHGQIYAYPFVTPRTQRELDSAQNYQTRTWRNLFADVLDAEQRAEVRVVRRTKHWTAFVPEAARWPLEVHLYPNRQVADLPALTDTERDEFCAVYLDVLRRMDAVFGERVPYVAAWHQAPVRMHRDLAYLRLELISTRRAPGKLKYLAGSEAAMGVFVNDVLPETTAQRLRQARA